jgi:hypothetical protein
MAMTATPEQIAKAETLRKAAEARRLDLPAAPPPPPVPKDADRVAELEKLVEELHWQLHCERRRADAATARAARAIAQAKKLDVCADRTDRS